MRRDKARRGKLIPVWRVVPHPLTAWSLPAEAYGSEMAPLSSIGSDTSEAPFCTDLLEALTTCVDLINSGRSVAVEGLGCVQDVQTFEPVKLVERSRYLNYLCHLLGLDGRAGLVDPYLAGQGLG
jgi:hypothetical protein